MSELKLTGGDDGEPFLICRIFIPKLNGKKTINLNPLETVGAIKKDLIVRLGLTPDETLNYGIYLPKAGIYLEEQRTLASYYFSDNVYFEFKDKQREQSIPEKVLQKQNTPKIQKQFSDYIIQKHYNKMKGLASKGLDPNFILENGETPLTTCATNNDVEGITGLITEMGAFIEFRSTDGKTALHKAAAAGHLEALKLLLNYGSSPNYRDKNNITPLYDACMFGRFECAKALLEANSPINVIDAGERTELHQACSKGLENLVELLISYGADINHQNEPGNSPLHMCCSKNQSACALILLKNGANKEIMNKAGHTAVQLAIMFGNLEIGEMITNFNGPYVTRKRKPDIFFDTDPSAKDFIPPPPPINSDLNTLTNKIFPPPPNAPLKRKIVSLLPPPPPPFDPNSQESEPIPITFGSASISRSNLNLYQMDQEPSPPQTESPPSPDDEPPPLSRIDEEYLKSPPPQRKQPPQTDIPPIPSQNQSNKPPPLIDVPPPINQLTKTQSQLNSNSSSTVLSFRTSGNFTPSQNSSSNLKTNGSISTNPPNTSLQKTYSTRPPNTSLPPLPNSPANRSSNHFST